MVSSSSPLKGSILVTGANGGLGTALTSHISTHYPDYHGIYTVRDVSSPFTAPSTSSHELIPLDLSSLSTIRTTANDINAWVSSGKIPPIRILILNAGFLEFEQQTWAPDGFDMSFAVNYLGHFLLILLLLQSMNRDEGRIVLLGSSTHDPYAPIVGRHFPEERWKTIIQGEDIKAMDGIAYGTWSSNKDDPSLHSGFRRYGAAKLCVAMLVGELQERLSKDPFLSNLTVVGIDPGTMSTGIVRHASWFVQTVLHGIVIANVARVLAFAGYRNAPVRTPESSARDVLDAGMNAKWKELGGGVYLDGMEIGKISEEAKDEGKRELVWRESVRLVGLREGETVLRDWR
ncbi:putative short-chain dehydrogenase [Aspergillus sclerotioniger CBS 115572]|uniref:Putative short-chain dehydrogenase n=1 Tax=Aspergillus sclerotioniger CBS 115572 TaxID=1450535 RepID=A0A317X9B5_9EURO|nr:putative short-chain dehydrogenase [Aspergillus sclerotioniger CBS 115572]PWY94771.1 putative short-chain dehydrogenase [Aspergillus sclerotioniger CBS 115572]